VTYRRDVRILLPIAAPGADRVKLTVTSQGCADIGVCYVPQSRASISSSPLRLFAPCRSSGRTIRSRRRPSGSRRRATKARFTGVLEAGRLWAVVLVFFVAGLLLTFTPCVLP